MQNKLAFVVVAVIIILAIALYSSTAINSKDADVEKKSESNLQSNTFECKGTTLCYIGKVTKVVDGDTIYIDDLKIRLSLTNTPEKDQEGFIEAKNFTAELCKIGTIAKVDQDDRQPTDRYGRILGKVYCENNKVLNAELLREGLAHILKQYCNVSEFVMEDWAQQNGCT